MELSFKKFLESQSYWGDQGAGILAIATDIGKWLVAFRSEYVMEPGTWGIIGGKIDEEDASNPQLAAKREFIEETKYTGPIKLTKASIWKSPEIDPYTNKPVFIFHNFIGEIVKGRWEPEIDWETEYFKWVSYDELMRLSP